jgi:hypothetical protein
VVAPRGRREPKAGGLKAGKRRLAFTMSWPFFFITLMEETSGLTQPGQTIEKGLWLETRTFGGRLVAKPGRKMVE